MSPHIQLASTLTHMYLATSKPAATGKSSPFVSIVILAVIFGGLYFLFLRPRSQRMKARQQQISSFDVGDEIMLTSGIIGTITAMEGDRAHIEIAPDIEIVVVKAAIAQRVQPRLTDDDIAVHEDDDEDDDGGGEHGEHGGDGDDDEQDDVEHGATSGTAGGASVASSVPGLPLVNPADDTGSGTSDDSSEGDDTK